MRKESFIAANDKILDYFESLKLKAFTKHDVMRIFSSMRDIWKIASYRNYYDFLKFLNEADILKPVKLKHLNTGSEKYVYTRPGIEHAYIGQTIKKDGYISFYSALYYHQLTLQIPKSIYVSYDKYLNRFASETTLTQDAIDKAFSKHQRMTSEVYRSESDNTRFFFIQRKSQSVDLGIEEHADLKITNLERTLIDCMIRPNYSGGVFEVLEAFKKATPLININKLDIYLSKMDYIYPYHQLLGFYLEKSGFNGDSLKIFEEKISPYNFYMTYNMSAKNLDAKWKIYYPKGF